ncbi:hypothetical protein ACOYW6_09655 [Parablastomonas sp. CN1-191]|uniref:hypothetical protein n=1 Tax=Parablastomonas sp. CN1-191 TaxID=3400908 RepID=UPI003BF7F9E5
MSDLRRIGTTNNPGDDIEEAEFEEVGASPRNRQTKAAKRPLDWRTILIAIVGGMFAWMLAVAAARAILAEPTGSRMDSAATDVSAANPRTPTPDQARAMLATWTHDVTGQSQDGGIVLVDGEGEPFTPCQSRKFQKVLRFGGMKLTGTNEQVHNAFRLQSIDSDQAVEGYFWFDADKGTVLIFQSAITDKADKPIRWLPDATIDLRPTANGRLPFQGTQFHVCETDT